MNTFELSDALLERALSVNSQAAPATLRGKVREAVAAADRGRGAGLSWGTGPTTFRRPALGGALWFVLLTGLVVVAVVGAALLVGSPPPTVVPTPTASSSPSPSSVAVVPVPEPTVAPSPTVAPGPTRTLLPSPAPLPTAGPEVAPTSFEDYAAHITDSLGTFYEEAMAWYVFATSLDGYADSRPFVEEWLPNEKAWLAANRPAPCYATGYAVWARAVAAVDDATHRAGGEQPFSSNPDFPGIWAPRFSAVNNFQPTIAFGCAPIRATEFADHVHASLLTFGPAADGLYLWAKSLDDGSRADVLRLTWLPTELRWLNVNDPVPCLEGPWQTWTHAVREMDDASRWIGPFGSMDAEEEARFIAARRAVEDFNPTTTNC